MQASSGPRIGNYYFGRMKVKCQTWQKGPISSSVQIFNCLHDQVDGTTDYIVFVPVKDLPQDILVPAEVAGIKEDLEAHSDYIAFCSWLYLDQAIDQAAGLFTGKRIPGACLRFKSEAQIGALNEGGSGEFERVFGKQHIPLVDKTIFLNMFSYASKIMLPHFPPMLFPSLARTIGNANYLSHAFKHWGDPSNAHPHAMFAYELAYERAADQRLLRALINTISGTINPDLAAAFIQTCFEIPSRVANMPLPTYPEQIAGLYLGAKHFLLIPFARHIAKAIEETTEKLPRFFVDSARLIESHLDFVYPDNLGPSDPFEVTLK